MDDERTADVFGLDPDPERGHADIPLELDQLHGRQVIVDDGETREAATMVIVPGLFRMAARLRSDGERIVRIWRAGNLKLWSAPVAHGEPAVVEITDEEGTTRLESIRFPAYVALVAAQRQGGEENA